MCDPWLEGQLRLADRMGHLSHRKMNHVQVLGVGILRSIDRREAAESSLRQFKISRAAVAPQEIPDLFPREMTQREASEAFEDGTISDEDVPWTVPTTDEEREELEDLISSIQTFVPSEGGDSEWL